MKAKELYEKATGDLCPDNQIAYHDWHIRYVAWLEKEVEILNSIRGVLDSIRNKQKECTK